MKISNLTKFIKMSLLFPSLLIVSACSFAPEYVRPTLDMPETWPEYSINDEVVSGKWWERFEDERLNTIVEKALANNYDLLIAAEQVNQALGYLGVARADLLPNINGGGSAGEAMQYKTSEAAPRVTSDSYTLNFQAAWELDFWGKYRNANNAAREQLLASQYGKDSLKLLIAAQTATAYFTLLSLDEQLTISYRTLQTREESLRIYKAQYKEGLINELDFLRASTEVDTVRTAIFQLIYQIDNAETALQVLMGESPRQIFEEDFERGKTLTQLPNYPQPPAGIPSDLLSRRPDILAAEANLRAANFKVGVAKAQWFPSISLTGLLGVQSIDLDALFKGMAHTWSYGATVATPIFQAGRISSNVKISEAAMREATLKYSQTVQTAFKEIRTALSVQASIGNVVTSLDNIVDSLTKAVNLAQIRYDNGYASYLEVLDAQRSLFDSEIQLANARAQQLSTIVNICLALGGGWSAEEE